MGKIVRIAVLLVLLSISYCGWSQNYAIPDSNFKNYLYSHYPNLFNASRQLIITNAKTFTGAISCEGQNIKDLSGLQFFQNVNLLNCNNNPLQTLPSLDSLKAIQFIWATGCGIKQLPKINHLTTLLTLDIKDNALTSLPSLTGMTSLQYLDCGQNNLTFLPDLSTLTNLKTLYCFGNQLTGLPSLSGLVNLQKLDCNNNKITALPSLKNLTNLQELVVSYNRLSSLPDFINNQKLSGIYAVGNNLKHLPGLSTLSSLVTVDVKNNQLGFEELLKLSSHPGYSGFFMLSPQDTIKDYRIENLIRGEVKEVALTFDSSVTSSTYTWYKNGVLYKTTTSNGLLFSPLSVADSGTYYCKIVNSNPKMTGITLDVVAFKLTVSECITSNSYQYSILSNACEEGAEVEVDTSILSGPNKPFEVKLIAVYNQQEITATGDKATHVIPGKYDLKITDKNSCSVLLKEFIYVPAPSGCSHVITPNGDGVEDTFFIERPGNAKIYNKSGLLIKEFKAPYHWDGTNISGNVVPMGYYMIIIDGKEKIGVVVVN